MQSVSVNSLAVDPQFSGTPGPQVAPETYRLAAGSPLRGAGRVGGVSSGAAVHIGAYDTDTRVIGQMRERDTLAPAAPSGLTVR